jgi:hypothetical protein
MQAMHVRTVVVPRRALSSDLLRILHDRDLRVLVDWTVFAGPDIRATYPDSVPIGADGAPFDRDGWYVPACPSHTGLRRDHLHAMQATLATHGARLAGLWLDFIRFPVRWERPEPRLAAHCFCPNCLRSFLQVEDSAISTEQIPQLARSILAEQHTEWVAWKCTSIVDFVKAVRTLIDEHAPHLQVGMFSLPWQRQDFDGAIRSVAGQDLGRLAPFIDCYSPMVYHLLCGQSPDWVQAVAEDVHAWTQKPVLPIIQSMDQPETLSPTEFAAALSHAQRANGASGALVFTLAPLLESPEKVEAVRNLIAP